MINKSRLDIYLLNKGLCETRQKAQGFILAGKVEKLTLQMFSIYDIDSLLSRPIFLLLIFAIVNILLYSIFKKGRIDYA